MLKLGLLVTNMSSPGITMVIQSTSQMSHMTQMSHMSQIVTGYTWEITEDGTFFIIVTLKIWCTMVPVPNALIMFGDGGNGTTGLGAMSQWMLRLNA